VDFTIRRAMRANPGERQTSCREFMEDLLGEAWKSRAAGNSGTHQPPPPDDLWYMVFYDCGFPKTVKGDTDTIRKNIRAGVLGDLSIILVSRTKAGPFSPLRTVPEFRDLLLDGGTTTGPGAPMSNTVLNNVPNPFQPAPLASGVISQTPLDRHLEPRLVNRITPLPPTLARPEADKPPTDECDALPVVTPQGLLSTRIRRPPLRLKPARPSVVWKWVAVAAVALAVGIAVGLLFRS
jgi:hypothetical protein